MLLAAVFDGLAAAATGGIAVVVGFAVASAGGGDCDAVRFGAFEVGLGGEIPCAATAPVEGCGGAGEGFNDAVAVVAEVVDGADADEDAAAAACCVGAGPAAVDAAPVAGGGAAAGVDGAAPEVEAGAVLAAEEAVLPSDIPRRLFMDLFSCRIL